MKTVSNLQWLVTIKRGILSLLKKFGFKLKHSNVNTVASTPLKIVGEIPIDLQLPYSPTKLRQGQKYSL